MKSILKILGGAQILLGLSFGLQECFEEYLTEEYRGFLSILRAVEEQVKGIDKYRGAGEAWVGEAEFYTGIFGDAVFSHRHSEGSAGSVRGGCEPEEDLWVSSSTGCSYLFAAVEGVCGEWGVGSSTERAGAAVSRGRVGRTYLSRFHSHRGTGAAGEL